LSPASAVGNLLGREVKAKVVKVAGFWAAGKGINGGPMNSYAFPQLN